MTEGHDGAMEEHARSAPTHDSAYLFAHIVTVAVDGARRAEGLDLHAWTADDAVMRVIEEAAAVGAQCGGTVRRRRTVCVLVSATVEGDHLRHHVGFEGAFLFGVHVRPFTEKVIRQGQLRCLVRNRDNFLDKQPRGRCQLCRLAM